MNRSGRFLAGVTMSILALAPILGGEPRPGDDATARCRAMLDDSATLTATDLAENARRIEQWHAAFELCQRAGVPLELRVKSYLRLASWLETKRRQADAVRALQDVHDIVDREAGPDSPLLIDVLIDQAGHEAEAGNLDEAGSLLERAQAIRERAFGATSKNAVEGLLMLALHDQAAGRIASAEKAFLKVVETGKTIGCRPPDCTFVRQAYGALAEMLRDVPGREADAASYQKEALQYYPRQQRKD